MTYEHVVTTARSVRAARQLRMLLHLKGASMVIADRDCEYIWPMVGTSYISNN